MLIRLVLVLLVDEIIGLERVFHGQSAGSCAHFLKCMFTGLLTLLTSYQLGGPRGDHPC